MLISSGILSRFVEGRFARQVIKHSMEWVARTGWPYFLGNTLAIANEGLRSSGGEREETIRTAYLVPGDID
jgi:hypothetical protein